MTSKLKNKEATPEHDYLKTGLRARMCDLSWQLRDAVLGKKYDIFLICPVRGLTEEKKEQIGKLVSDLEAKGKTVYWPPRDTDQNDPVGLRICGDNRRAIKRSKEVLVWYDENSTGSKFDLGITFGSYKKVSLANPGDVIPTDGKKGFNNVLLALHRKTMLKKVQKTLELLEKEERR